TRRSEEREEVAFLLLGRSCEGLAQQAELALPSHHRGFVAPHWLAVRHAHEPEGLDWLGLALELQGLHRLGFDRISNKPIRAGSQNHLARPRGLLTLRRHAHAVTA